MVKFTIEEKINAITRYLNGADGYSTIAKDIGVHYSKLQYWVKKYQYHGKKAFLKNYTNYPVQYKLDVLNYMNENGTSIFETAAIFNLSSDSILWNGQRLLETKGLTGLVSKKKGRPSMTKRNQKVSKKQAPAEGSVEAL